MTVIGVINRSQRLRVADVRLMTRACDVQMRRHVAPEWDSVPWRVRYFAPDAKLPRDCIPIVIFDRPDEPDAYGYHSETDDGYRYGRVFANPVLGSGGTVLGLGTSVSVTLSHEVIEAFIDPDVNLWAEDGEGVLWAYEACDPVEADSYRIKVGSRLVGVSDFVHRAWFDEENPSHSRRFDHMGVTDRPFQIAPDGYAIYWDGGPQEKITYGARYPRWRKAGKRHELARTARRGAAP